MNRPVIFLGPSLPIAQAREVLPDATIVAPARQGDVWRVVRACHPSVVGLIDGAFLDVPAVWHREILWALQEGVPVLGAASMGALRAAELAAFGMIGVGKIFAAYRDGCYPPFDPPFEDDDEVAVVHAPCEIGGQSLSDAMTDLRETLAAAAAAGEISVAERDSLASVLKRLHFSERSFQRLAEASLQELGSARGSAFTSWLHANRISQKRRDAVELLDRVAVGDFCAPAPFRMERALVWEAFLASDDPVAGPSDVSDLVLSELALDPPAWERTLRAAHGRAAALRCAPDGGDEMAALDLVRRRSGLLSGAQLNAWMEANALDAKRLSALLADEARLTSGVGAAPGPEIRRMMADLLRLEGHFALFRARAMAKRGSRPPPGGPAMDEAMAWFFEERLQQPVPRSVEKHAVALGYPSADALRRAVWAEFTFVSDSGRQ